LLDENTGEFLDVVPAPIAVVSDNGSCFRGEIYQAAFAGDDPLLRDIYNRIRPHQSFSDRTPRDAYLHRGT
jgi:putative transposase